MISLYCWNTGQKAGLWLNAEVLRTKAEQLLAAPDVYWIDLDNPTREEENLVYEGFFPVHRLTLLDITRLRRKPGSLPHFPKVEEFPNYLFVVVNPLRKELLGGFQARGQENADAGGRSTTQLSTVLTEKVLITHHYEPVPSIEELRDYLAKHEEQAGRGPDYLFHLILDAMVDQFAPVLDHFDNALDQIEMKVFAKPTPKLLMRLLKLKRAIVLLHKNLIYEREVLARLARGDLAMIQSREMAYFRNVYDHIIRFTELIGSSRDMASDLMQTHLSATSNKLNEIMKVLAMISTVVLPMTLIAGIYGMNFKTIPEIDWPFGYPFALGLMGLTGVAAFIFFFRWKKWI
jgi:magnesium transporter